MKLLDATFAATLALATPLVPAAAQARAAITVGMQVTDINGGPIGAVAALQGDNLLVRTDKHEALLPKASFTVSEGKLYFGMTRAELNAEIEKSLAAAAAAVAAGAIVQGTGGATVGVLEAVDAQTATIKLASGKSIRVPRAGIRGNADGTVMIALTADQLEAQVEASTATEPATDAGAGQ